VRTKKNYSGHIVLLRQVFGHKGVRDLTRLEIGEWMHVSKGKISRNRTLATFSAVYREALGWGWVDGNPCFLIERHQSKARQRNLTEEEYQAARNLALSSKRKSAWRIAVVMDLSRYTGQLQSNILTLLWSQVHDPVILFRHHVTKKRIEALMTPQIRTALAEAAKHRGKSELVIPSGTGEIYTGEGFRAVWQRLMRKHVRSGYDRFTFNDIRMMGSKKGNAEERDPVDDYPQFDQVFRDQAAQMAPYYRVFFCLEQSIRQLVTHVLQGAVGPGWWDSDKIAQNMRQEVAALITREVDTATTQRSMRMIDYTTFGQLGSIIRENWDLFEASFVSKGAVSAVISRLNLARGPIAHCCVMSDHEIERLGITIQDWYNIMRKPPES
jgi:hypothetical protein